MNLQELQRLMDARSEDEHLEFKEAKNRFDFEKLVGYCVALANERGGKMILGVSDKPPRKVVGTSAFDVPERTVAGIYERLHIKVTFHEIAHPDGRVLIFDVPSRPVGQLPASEEIAAALRKTTHAYPKKAIRELVGNAIVHQDFNERGTGITVEIFDDRVEITNPGLPILEVDRFIDENQSRNERFANAMRQLGICEERGHGIDEVVSHIEVFQLPPYRCRLGSRHTTIVLSRYKSLKDLAPEERVHAVYQHCCLRFVNNEITNNESIRSRFGIEKQNSAQASRMLNEALDAGRIRLVNPDAANKLRRYMPYWA